MATISVTGPDPTDLTKQATMQLTMADDALLLTVQAMCTHYNYQAVVDNPAYNPSIPAQIANPNFEPPMIRNPDYVSEYITDEEGNLISNPEYAGAPEYIENPEYDLEASEQIANPDYQPPQIANPVGPGTFALLKTVDFWMGHSKAYVKEQGVLQGAQTALEQIQALENISLAQIE